MNETSKALKKMLTLEERRSRKVPRKPQEPPLRYIREGSTGPESKQEPEFNLAKPQAQAIVVSPEVLWQTRGLPRRGAFAVGEGKVVGFNGLTYRIDPDGREGKIRVTWRQGQARLELCWDDSSRYYLSGNPVLMNLWVDSYITQAFTLQSMEQDVAPEFHGAIVEAVDAIWEYAKVSDSMRAEFEQAKKEQAIRALHTKPWWVRMFDLGDTEGLR
jgi:hypothetical protein